MAAQDCPSITACHWGVVVPQVRNGRLVGVTPFAADRAPSPNLAGVAALPYAESRVRYPMVREGFLMQGAQSREKRGSDKWVRVSWEEALDLTAREIRRIYAEYGPSAVFGRSYGWKSTGAVNCAMQLQHRLLNLLGGFVWTKNSYSTAAIGVILPYVLGSRSPKSTTWESVLMNAERVVFWGCDPLVTLDIDESTTLHRATAYVRSLKDCAEIQTIAINPLQTDTALYLGSSWIAPRPGTDCALMLAMIYELVTSGQEDSYFLEHCCYGWGTFREYVLGHSDGVPKTPRWAADITGVAADKIVALTHDLREHRTMIAMGWGPQRAQFGEQPPWMATVLAAALGSMGEPGGGISFDYHYAGGIPAGRGPKLGTIPNLVKPVRDPQKPWKGSPYIPVARFVDALENPGKTIAFNGEKLVYPDLKMILWAGGNPFAHQPDTGRLERAWKKPETVIVCATHWSATARQADIVLPVQTFFEHDDIARIGDDTNDGIVAMKKAIEPLWEAQSDYWIYSELAKRLGVEREFTEGRTESQWIETLYESAARRGRAVGLPMPDFKDFWRRGYLIYDLQDTGRKFTALEDLRRNPRLARLATESGLVQIVSPKIASFGYKDCPGMPQFFAPTEGGNRKLPGYPLSLICPKSPQRLHSQLDPTSGAAADIAGREPCWIHPTDADARGIQTGDVVEVKSPRGAILAGALVTDRVAVGTVAVHHGGWYEPEKTSAGRIDIHGNANTLTPDWPTSQLSDGNIASTASVQVSKWTGTAPTVRVYEAPAIAGL